MARKKINQSDLRRLMKERSSLVAKEEKVESPLAKYDKLGRLSCVACGEEVTVPWRHHILSRNHKENINKKLKRKTQAVDDEVPRDLKYQAISSTSGQVPLNGNFNHKKEQNAGHQVPSESGRTQKPLDRIKTNTSLIQGYSSSSSEDDEPMEEEDSIENPPSDAKTLPGSLSEVLPPDFFEVAPSTSSPVPGAAAQNHVAKPEHSKPDSDSKKNSASEGLPEGFFDDPVLDAKARNVEYKDPMEEEWEKFQKSMAEEANVSQNIMEEDVERSEIERDIDQIEQMIHSWKKVNELQSKGEELQHKIQSKKSSSMKGDSEDSSIEEEDLEYLLDWRAKSSSKR